MTYRMARHICEPSKSQERSRGRDAKKQNHGRWVMRVEFLVISIWKRTCHVSKVKSWHYRCMNCMISWWLLYLFSPYIEETLVFGVISLLHIYNILYIYIYIHYWISMYIVQVLSIFFMGHVLQNVAMIGPNGAGNCTDRASRSQSLPWMADSGQSCFLNRRWGWTMDCRKPVCGEALWYTLMGVNILNYILSNR